MLITNYQHLTTILYLIITWSFDLSHAIGSDFFSKNSLNYPATTITSNTPVTSVCAFVAPHPAGRTRPFETIPLVGAATSTTSSSFQSTTTNSHSHDDAETIHPPITSTSFATHSQEATFTSTPSTLLPQNQHRRTIIQTILFTPITMLSFSPLKPQTNLPCLHPPSAMAYDPDPDPLRESLYLISRVQEATVQQERFVRRATNQQDLKQKMKLTLLLIEKNYKLVDQIIYCSSFLPSEHLVEATEAGNIAAEELQSAIDYVRSDLSVGELSQKQKDMIINSLTNTREQLFVFLEFMPRDKLDGARARIENENKLNIEEFDGDENAGVYNPVQLPWKNR
jgi:hypothetical protein